MSNSSEMVCSEKDAISNAAVRSLFAEFHVDNDEKTLSVPNGDNAWYYPEPSRPGLFLYITRLRSEFLRTRLLVWDRRVEERGVSGTSQSVGSDSLEYQASETNLWLQNEAESVVP